MSYITTGECIGYKRGQQEQAENLVLRQLQKRFGKLPQSAREQAYSPQLNSH